MKIRVDEERNSAYVNLTPMIDVVFLLVIFFMVTTTFIQLEKEMDIDLPESASGESITNPQEEIVINMRRDGSLLVNGTDVTLEQLSDLLRQAVSVDPNQAVILRGDRSAFYDKVVRVLDVCAGARISNFQLAALEPQ